MKEKCKNCGKDWHVGITCKEQAKIEALSCTPESAGCVSEQKLKEATTKLFKELRVSTIPLDQTGVDVLEENFWDLLA